MQTIKLSTKYQMVIPRVVRKKMHLKIGSSLIIYTLDEEQALLVKRPTDYVKALKGFGKDVWQKLGGTEHYIQQERTSWNK